LNFGLPVYHYSFYPNCNVNLFVPFHLVHAWRSVQLNCMTS
jgi:hypothetical protein